MKRFHLPTSLILTIGVLLLYVQPVLAFPSLPSSFYGTVKVDGANVPAGTVVSAKINGIQYASTIINLGDIYYSLDIPGDDPDTPGTLEGGVQGDTIAFYIGTTKATQTGTWHSGSIVSLNLTGSTNIEPPTSLFLPLILR
jgi:hypothetical protein